VGSTSGTIEERLRRHLTASSGFTSKARDWEVVYTEAFSLKTDAMKRERQIKSWKSRKAIEQLLHPQD
jgi:putative endonuclease